MTSTETRDDVPPPADAEADSLEPESDDDDDEPRATCEGGLARF